MPKPPKWLAAQQAAERASKKKRAAKEGGVFADLLRARREERAKVVQAGGLEPPSPGSRPGMLPLHHT